MTNARALAPALLFAATPVPAYNICSYCLNWGMQCVRRGPPIYEGKGVWW